MSTYALTLLSLCVFHSTTHSTKFTDDFYQKLQDLETANAQNEYFDEYYYDEDDEEEVAEEEEFENEGEGTISDYTLYFNDYNFDWDREEDWDQINLINHHNDDESAPYQEVEACTFEIAAIQKRVCVHSKRDGGFTIHFKSPHHSEYAAAKSLHSDSMYSLYDNEDNVDDNADDDISDFYDNIELDWDNDADWSQISHSFSDYDSDAINTKHANDMMQLQYAHRVLAEYQNALQNYNKVYYDQYGAYPQDTMGNQYGDDDGFTKDTSSSAAAAHQALLDNFYGDYGDYDYYDDLEGYDDDEESLPMTDPFTQQMQDTLDGPGKGDLYNLYGSGMGGLKSMMGGAMGGTMNAARSMPGMMQNPFSPQGPNGPQSSMGRSMINSMAQGMDASRYMVSDIAS